MKKTIVSVAAVGALCAAPLFAQDKPRATQPATPSQPGQQNQQDESETPPARPEQEDQPRTQSGGAQGQRNARAADQTEAQDHQGTGFAQHVAACLILSNEAEIALTEPAIEKLQSDEARELAQVIVKDHTAFVAKLKPHAPHAANLKLNVRAAQPNASGAQRNEDAAEANPTGEPAHDNSDAADRSAAGSMADKALRIEKSYVERKVSMLQERLNKEEGQNFDQAFLGCQIAAHVSMLAKLEALKPEVQDQELSQLIQQAQTSTEKHLQEAEKLMSAEKNVEEGQGRDRTGDATPRTDRATPQR